MLSSHLRAASRAALYVGLTVPLMPVQAVALAARSRASERIPLTYHRACRRVLGIEVREHGAVSAARPTLFVANHLSYLDITILSSVLPASFIAKSEIADWPFFGWLAKLQRTVFVERRARTVAGERDEIASRLGAGDNLVLFAEGTSGDGNRLRRFKSALFAAADREVAGNPVRVQPVSLAYTRLDGMPLGRTWRPLVAWYGDMDLMPHLWEALGAGRLTAEITFHPPVTIAELGSRKALAEHCERAVARGLSSANAGRPPEAARLRDERTPTGEAAP